jgi:hypothetical protein
MNGSGAGGLFLSIVIALIGLATVAVILSQNAQTSAVIQALGSAIGTSIGAATAPVTNAGKTG